MKNLRILAALLLAFGSLLIATPAHAVFTEANIVCQSPDGESQESYLVGWDNEEPFFDGKGYIPAFFCEGGYSMYGEGATYVSDDLADSSLGYYAGTSVSEPEPEPTPTETPPPTEEPTMEPAPEETASPEPQPEEPVEPEPTPSESPAPEPTEEATESPTTSPTPTESPSEPALPSGDIQVYEGQELTITAPEGYVISGVVAWYGDPNDANCGVDVSHLIASLAIGQTQVTLVSNNSDFGDPCPGVVKVLFVTLTYELLQPSEPVDEPTASPEPTPEPSPEPTPEPTPEPSPQPEPAPVVPEPSLEPVPPVQVAPEPEPSPEPTPSEPPVVEPSPSPEPSQEPTPEPTPDPTPEAEPTVEPTPEPVVTPKPEPSVTPTPTPEPAPSPEASPEPEEQTPTVTPTPEPSPAPTTTQVPKPAPTTPQEVTSDTPIENVIAVIQNVEPSSLTEEQAAVLVSVAYATFETAERGSEEYEQALELLAVAAEADDPELPQELAAVPLIGNVAGAVLDVLNDLGNVGADMSPEVREDSEKVVVAAVIVGQIAMTATAAATSAASTAARRP